MERLQDFLERSFEPGRVFANELDYQMQLDTWFAERANARQHKSLRERPAPTIGRGSPPHTDPAAQTSFENPTSIVLVLPVKADASTIGNGQSGSGTYANNHAAESGEEAHRRHESNGAKP